MAEKSSPNALPASYRLGLAVSLALLFHTLLLSGVPTPLEEQMEAHRESVSFQLVSPGARETIASVPEKSGAHRRAPQIPPFEVEPLKPENPPEPERVTTRQPETSSPVADTNSPNNGPARASTSTRAGKKPEHSQEKMEQSITRITESPAKVDPYVVKLATHLARSLEELRVPAMRSLAETVAMKVELQLLENGALTRARVLKSTGIASIDEAAYRAALAASPYPQPPEGDANRNRFEVELLFTPKRL